VALHARVPVCVLKAHSSTPLAFLPVLPGQSEVRVATFRSEGMGACEVRSLYVDDEPAFRVEGPVGYFIPPGYSVDVTVRFTAPATPPAKRVGTLSLDVASETAPFELPLEATIQL
jgi:hypothetical protein